MPPGSAPAATWCIPAGVGRAARLPERSKADRKAVDADEQGLRLGFSGEGKTP